MAAHGGLPLTRADVDAGIGQIAAARRTQASGREAHLREVEAGHSLGDLRDPDWQELLRHRLVYEYMDQDGYWYGVCPLCREGDPGA